MNLQSIALLIIVLIVAGFVLIRYIKRQKRTGGCGSCNCACDQCPSRKK